MSLAAPLWLLSLLVIPLVVVAAVLLRDRRDRYAIRFPAAATLARAAADVRSPLRHLPPVLLLTGLALLGLSLARPARSVTVPIEGATVVLVTDHSGSMSATDVLPSRLAAAVKASLAFIAAAPKQARIGLVTYSGAIDQAIQPTTDHDKVRSGVTAQEPGGSTKTGDALRVALSMIERQRSAGHNRRRPPAAIVLLSDGKADPDSDPLPVAEEAARSGVQISTVALGTADAVITVEDPRTGLPVQARVPPDPESMAEIARIAHGRTFTASDQDKLASIYESLGASLATQRTKRDITRPVALAGLIALLFAAAASAAQAGRVP